MSKPQRALPSPKTNSDGRSTELPRRNQLQLPPADPSPGERNRFGNLASRRTAQDLLSLLDSPSNEPDSLPSIFSNSSDHLAKQIRPKSTRNRSEQCIFQGVAQDTVPRSNARRSSVPIGDLGVTDDDDLGIDERVRSYLEVRNDDDEATASERRDSPGKGSQSSCRTDISRKILHGLPDMRMLDFARSVSKGAKSSSEHEDGGSTSLHSTHAPSKPETSMYSSQVPLEWQRSGQSTVSSPPVSLPVRGMSGVSTPGIRFKDPEGPSESRISTWSRSDRRLSGASLDNHHSPSSASESLDSSRRGSGDHGESHSHFSLLHKHSRPRMARSSSSQANSSSSVRRIAEKQREDMPISPPLRSGVFNAESPAIIATPTSPHPATSSISNISQDVVSPKPARSRRFLTKLAEIMTPGPRPEAEKHLTPATAAASTTKQAEDYFNLPTKVSKSHPATPLETFTAGEAIRVPTPPHVKPRHRRRKTPDDELFDYLPPAQLHTSDDDSFWFNKMPHVETAPTEMRRGPEFPWNVGLMTDPTLVREHRPHTVRGEENDWFRQRMDDIMGEDDEEEDSAFDWDIPVHLPQSPLCPLNPKHKSGGKGVCVYHGRRKNTKDAIVWTMQGEA